MTVEVGPISAKLVVNATGWTRGLQQARSDLNALQRSIQTFSAKAEALKNFDMVASKLPRDTQFDNFKKALIGAQRMSTFSPFKRRADESTDWLDQIKDPATFRALQQTADLVERISKFSASGAAGRNFKEAFEAMPKDSQLENINRLMKNLGMPGTSPRGGSAGMLTASPALARMRAEQTDWPLPSSVFANMRDPRTTGRWNRGVPDVNPGDLRPVETRNIALAQMRAGPIDQGSTKVTTNLGMEASQFSPLRLALSSLKQDFVSLFGEAKAGLKDFSQLFQFSLTGWVTRLAMVAIAIKGVKTAFGLLTGAIATAASFERTKIQFESLMNSSKLAKKTLDDLTTFSIPAPFHFTQFFAASRTLLAFGLQAKDLMGTIKLLGDVSAGSGKDIEELALIFGKTMQMGHLLGREAHQFVTAGIPLYDYLAKAMGKPKEAIIALQANGEVSFAKVLQALTMMTAKGAPFMDAMGRQSRTLEGLWSTLADTMEISTRRGGEAIIKHFDLKTLVRSLADFVVGVEVSFTTTMSKARIVVLDWAVSLVKVAATLGLVISVIYTLRAALWAATKAMVMLRAIGGGARGLAELGVSILGFVLAWKLVGAAADAAGDKFSEIAAAGHKSMAEALEALKFRPLDPKEAEAKAAMGAAAVLVDSLKEELMMFGMTEREASLFKLTLKGVGDEHLTTARAMSAHIEQLKYIVETAQFAGSIFEVYRERIRQLGLAVKSGSIDMRSFSNAKKKLDRDLEHDANSKAVSIWSETRSEFKQFTDQIALMSDLLKQGFIDWTLYGLGVHKAYESLAKATEVKMPDMVKALAYGTADEVSFRSKFENSQHEGKRDPAETLKQAMEQDKILNKRIVDELEKIHRAIGAKPPVIGGFKR